jgi:hypothetical protein
MLASGCRRNQVFRGTSLDDDAKEYVCLAVSLGARDPDSIDFYTGPAEWVAGARDTPLPLAQIRSDALTLMRKLQQTQTDGEDTTRKEFLQAQLHAIAGRVDVLEGKSKGFDDESVILFGVKAPANFDDAAIRSTKSELNKLLDGNGNVADQYGRYAKKFIIPSDKIPAAFSAALEECKRQTLLHLTLPQGEGITVKFVSQKPWAGFSRYLGRYRSEILINRDFAMGPEDVLNLACHEAYPGHHVLNSVREWKGNGWPEDTVQPTYSPQSLISEGAASYAERVAISNSEKAEFMRRTLFPMAGFDASEVAKYLRVQELIDDLSGNQVIVARSYVDGQLEFVRADQMLAEKAAIPEGASMLLYLNEYRSYAVTYTVGRQMVQSCVDEADEQKRWKTYYDVMTDQDSVAPCRR